MHLTEDSIVDFISTSKNKYIDFWKKKVESSTKLDLYGKFKYEHKAEDYMYLDIIPTINWKRDYTKFRTSNHKLTIETPRYPIVLREQRLREFCKHNEIEDEYHMIFSCKLYADLRETFLEKKYVQFLAFVLQTKMSSLKLFLTLFLLLTSFSNSLCFKFY